MPVAGIWWKGVGSGHLFPQIQGPLFFCSHFSLPISESLPETFPSCFPVFLIWFPILSPPGIGRWTNPQYRQFITILEATHRNHSAENKVRGSAVSPVTSQLCPSRQMCFPTRHTGHLLAHGWTPSPLHK